MSRPNQTIAATMRAGAAPQPKVNAKASTPGSRNSISNCRSAMGFWLSDQLIQPLFRHRAVALIVDISAVSSARRLSIDEHAKSHGRSSRCRSHDEMKIAGMKAVGDPPVGLVQRDKRFLHRPITRQRPTIESQPRRDSIDMRSCPVRHRRETQNSRCAHGRRSFRQTSSCPNRRQLPHRCASTATSSWPMPPTPASVSSC